MSLLGQMNRGIIWPRLARLVCLIGLAIVALAIVGCASAAAPPEASPTDIPGVEEDIPIAVGPVDLDPVATFARVKEEMAEVGYYRTDGAVSIEEGDVAKAFILRTDWAKPYQFHTVLRGLPNPDSYQEIISVGERAFRREAPDDRWSETNVVRLEPNLTGGLMDTLSKTSWESAAMESEDTIQLIGTDLTSMEFPSADAVRAHKIYNLRIDAETFLIEELQLLVTVEQGMETLSTQEATYNFSRYDHPVLIEAPIP